MPLNWTSVWLTLRVAGIATAGALLPGLWLAYLLATRARKPTHEVGERVRHPERGHDISYYGDPKFTGWGGGVPVWKDGKVVGAVAVSGLSSAEDADLASQAVDLITRSCV